MRLLIVSVVLLFVIAGCSQESAHVDRAHIEAVHETVQRMNTSGDFTGFGQLFAEDGTFVNSARPEPIAGPEAIAALAARWPAADQTDDWMMIDGNRLAFGWTSRRGDAPPQRGISTFVFNADGLVTSYEGMFDRSTLPPAATSGAVGSEAALWCDSVELQDAASVSSPAHMPEVYLARINAGDAEHVTDLFAADGVHRGPDGQIRKGRAAILEFYEGILASGPRNLAVGRSVADGQRVAFELINLMQPCNEHDPALAVDLMDINDDGQIQEFTVFSRPRPQ